ncbi:tyrosine-type recombinase/integrase [Kocuria carniphila]|uniref:tyrosine-type recombinase/integrase n=1 Tax=Kocuria carniphila TaxID=262208 RepID=UPI0034CFF213
MASIRERPRKDGSIVWAVLWRDADTGKQTSRTMLTLQDAQELADFLNANGNSFALAARAASQKRSTAPRVGEVVSRHIESLTGVAADTRAKYRRNTKRHILPALGAIPVDALTRADVAAWVNGMEIADKTKRNVHSVLSAALEGAVRDELVPGNIAKGIKISSGARAPRDPVYLTQDEIALILDTVDGPARMLVRLLLDSGMRWGEATALRPADLDLTQDHGVVHVTRAWKQTADGWNIAGPKTKRGRRTVVLPKAITVQLRDHVKDISQRSLIFVSKTGNRLDNSRFHKDVWKPTINAVDDHLHERPTIHDLRHTHASQLIAKGVPLTVIQRRLGHESIKTTSDTYGHLAADADVAAAAALD